MTDLDLLLLGCAVSFIAVGGAYIYIREQFIAQKTRRPHVVPLAERNESDRVA